jgi:hypothetical protein
MKIDHSLGRRLCYNAELVQKGLRAGLLLAKVYYMFPKVDLIFPRVDKIFLKVD